MRLTKLSCQTHSKRGIFDELRDAEGSVDRREGTVSVHLGARMGSELTTAWQRAAGELDRSAVGPGKCSPVPARLHDWARLGDFVDPGWRPGNPLPLDASRGIATGGFQGAEIICQASIPYAKRAA